jgi:S-disulfanyl-L-cysteine oxidoreductase SoxD
MGVWKMRCSPKLAIAVMVVSAGIACINAAAQSPDTYSNVGTTPTPQELKAWDIAVGPDGQGLPPGSGTAKEGAQIYAAKCAGCHGKNLEGVMATDPNPVGPVLIGGIGTLKNPQPVRTLASYWPFATTLWDYINRSMPRGRKDFLPSSEVYAVTAFLLFKNGIIKESDVMDAKSLPKVVMPNRNGFLPARFEDIPDLQKRGCRQGQCPESSSK